LALANEILRYLAMAGSLCPAFSVCEYSDNCHSVGITVQKLLYVDLQESVVGTPSNLRLALELIKISNEM
jgi:hypothetical protein